MNVASAVHTTVLFVKVSAAILAFPAVAAVHVANDHIDGGDDIGRDGPVTVYDMNRYTGD